MDTLSSSISISTIPKSNNLKNHHHHHHLHHHHHHHHPSLKPKTTTKLSNKTTYHNSFIPQNHHFLPPHINSYNSSRPPSPLKHSSSSPSTGYAVALLDAARRHNAVDTVHGDVKRLSKWLRGDQLRRAMADPSTDTAAKGEIVKEVVKRGRFEKHLVRLVKLLSEKGEVDLVREVLSEFGRIYEELMICVVESDNKQLLLLPRGLKMVGNRVSAIVGRIQKLTGVDDVTVANYI